MTPLFLATLSAALYGASDFLGGSATRRSPVPAVVLAVQLAGLVLLAPAMLVLPGRPSAIGLAWGMVAGLCGGAALVLLYRALAGGVMSVVAPTSATVATAVPVLVGLGTGERPAPTAMVGTVLGLVAVMMIGGALPRRDRSSLRSAAALGTCVVVGIALGGFVVALDQTPTGTGLWPLLAARTASIALLVVLGSRGGSSLRPASGCASAVLAAGLFDMAANVALIMALHRDELLTAIAVLSSQYPVSTILLARWRFGERLGRAQLIGVGFAMSAVGLMAAA